ncbi:dipeptidase [Brevibacterium luteolum]|uniref:dipeptidase n=1 Tax=Brevibacterium luteolum TaxID=199591 RepID=UPI00387941FE
MTAEPIPIFDGHNDLPYYLRETRDSSVAGLTDPATAPQTVIPQLRAGGVAAQFWSVFVHSDVTGDEAVRVTLEQIDLVDRLIRAYPDDLAWATTAEAIRAARTSGRIGGLLGIEGGNQINESLGALRMFARLGARYMTLTWSTTHSWADSATDDPVHGGLSDFGREVVAEMNRIGMILDLSHVAPTVMDQALEISELPVLFTHSNAQALCSHPRNVPDEIIDRLPANGGVHMLTFVPSFVSEARYAWVKDGEKGTAPEVTIADVADHIDYVRERIGVDHLGLGSDFCGTDAFPTGLDNAGTYPALINELRNRRWSEADLTKLGFDNVLRVLEANDDNYRRFIAAGQEFA